MAGKTCCGQFVEVARLQSEFWTKSFSWATNFLTKNAPKFSPKIFSLYFPSGPEETSWCRGTKIAERQLLSLSCLAITRTAGVVLKEEKCPLLWARDRLGDIFRRQFGEGNCESKIVSRQCGDNFRRETSWRQLVLFTILGPFLVQCTVLHLFFRPPCRQEIPAFLSCMTCLQLTKID